MNAFDQRYNNKNYFKSLDGLRAIAVLIVLTAHAGSPYPRSGGVGVDIFFVLSGFLITSILSSEAERFGCICLRNFYSRRFLRLLPCLLLTCFFVTIWTIATKKYIPVKEIVITLTYTANWAYALFNVDLSLLAHCWSLAIEEQYYIIWPFVIVIMERVTKNTLLKAIILLSVALLIAMYRYGVVGYYSAARIYFGLDTHMDGLVMGSSLCYFIKKNSSDGGITKAKSWVLGYVLVPTAIILIMVIMKIMTWTDPLMGKIGFWVVASATLVIIADLVAGTHSIIRKPLSLMPVVYIGRISYGIYLWHYPIFMIIKHNYPEINFVYLMPIKFGVSIFVASLSYSLVEVPFLRLKKIFERNDDIKCEGL